MRPTTIFSLVVLLIVLINSTEAIGASYVGCDVWYPAPFSIPPPTTGYSQQSVCQYGICNWYHAPECGQNCMVEVCFASQNPEESSPSCRATTNPAAVDIHCGLSKSFPIRHRHVSGTSAAFVCQVSGCSLYCVNTEADSIDAIIDDWNNRSWVTTGSRTFTCDCDGGICR